MASTIIAGIRHKLLEKFTSITAKFTVCDKVSSKLKLREIAKHGKAPRLIADLGVEASLIGGYACKLFKQFMASFDYDSRRFVESSDLAALESCFTMLKNPGRRGFFCYFSDGSCFLVS